MVQTKRIDQYICLDVDKIVADEMLETLSIKMPRTAHKIDRAWLAKLKRAARVILDNYTIPGT